MNEVIPAAVLPAIYISVAVQLRINTVDEGQAAEEGIAFADFRCLLADRFGKPVETLGCSHNDAPVLPVLGNHFQHLRREVLGLIGAEPVLHFVDAGNDTLDAVLVADEQTPVIQLCRFISKGKISDALCLRVFLPPTQSLLGHGDGLAVTLPAGEDDTALIADEFGIVSEIVCYHLLWKIVKQVLPERRFRYTDMFTLFEPSARAIGTDAVDQAAEAEKQEHTAEDHQRELEQGEECL